MKTNIYFRTAALIAALCCLFGCANPKVEIIKGFWIYIHPSTIISGFSPLRSEHLEMYDDSHLRITCLLYDQDGKLVYKEQSLLDNFNQDASFYTILGEGSYTVIALATCIKGTLTTPTDEAYSITGTESLDQLQIKQQIKNGFSYNSAWGVMGYASQSVSLDDSGASLNMKPAISLVYMHWQDIHAHDNDGVSSVYGKYSAKATDYWGKNTYSWTMAVEKDGSSSTDVIIKDLSPFLYGKGFTSDNGHNIFKGKISGNILTIAQGQKTGCSVDEMPILLYGMESNKVSDISLRIDNGKLTTTTMFGTYVQDESDGGWYDLFNSGVVFSKESSTSLVGIDAYGIIYHSNDIMRFDNNGSPIYSTSLGVTDDNTTWIEPAAYTSTNVYGVYNLFPGSSFNLFAGTFSGNTFTEYSKQTFTLVSGHQYVFSLDCATFKLTPYEGIFGTRSSINDFSTYEDYPQACHQLDLIKNN